MRRRNFNRLALSAVGPLLSPQTFIRPGFQGEPIKVIIDADTANEVDDLFAIVSGLLDFNLEVVGLTAAQYHTSPQAPRDSVGESYRLNNDILQLLNRDLPNVMGSNHPMVSQWRPQKSEAAEYIIDTAKSSEAGELNIAVLGPCTNVASAVLMAPEIIEKIKVHYIGFWHNPTTNTWNKREFNTNNDPNAVDVLLNNSRLNLSVMSASTSQHLVFQKSVVDTHLKGKGGIKDYLLDRWDNFDRWWDKKDPEKTKWIMWDVALIEALANPDLAKNGVFTAPHDNLKRDISVWTKIDVPRMKEAFWEKLDRIG